MAARTGTLTSPRLGHLVRRAPAERAEQAQQCELCGEPIEPEHRHLLDLDTRQLLCSCRACSLLFDRRDATSLRYRLVPGRRLRLEQFELGDHAWERLRLPVEMAFFFHNSTAGRVMAFYPSPMGATESRLELDAWSEIEAANPVLAGMERDVEALLVNRARGARLQWLVPIDDCYRLVAVIRTTWHGFSGGKEVWLEIERFFEHLQARSRPGTQATTAHSAEGS